jgi:hypothetical protein
VAVEARHWQWAGLLARGRHCGRFLLKQVEHQLGQHVLRTAGVVRARSNFSSELLLATCVAGMSCHVVRAVLLMDLGNFRHRLDCCETQTAPVGWG